MTRRFVWAKQQGVGRSNKPWHRWDLLRGVSECGQMGRPVVRGKRFDRPPALRPCKRCLAGASD